MNYARSCTTSFSSRSACTIRRWASVAISKLARVPIVFRDTKNEGRHSPETIEKFNEIFGEGSEIPSAGCYSTTTDYHKFALMLLASGSANGVNFLSPLTLRLATSIFTGDLPNLGFFLYRETRGWAPSPANLGLGFYVRGEGIYPTYFGTLNSPQAFGHPGLGVDLVLGRSNPRDGIHRADCGPHGGIRAAWSAFSACQILRSRRSFDLKAVNVSTAAP